MQTDTPVVFAVTKFSCAAVLAMAYGLSAAAAAHAGPEHAVAAPSPSQLRRLVAVEPYIRYFTSLEYGPERARTTPDLLRALLLAESGAQSWAHAPSGARGLAQIMPRTARHAAAELAASGYDFLYVDEADLDELADQDLFDPAVSILLASYLTARLHARFGGRIDLTIAAWNAGPSVVSRHGNRAPPYPETQRMIARVRGLMTLTRR